MSLLTVFNPRCLGYKNIYWVFVSTHFFYTARSLVLRKKRESLRRTLWYSRRNNKWLTSAWRRWGSSVCLFYALRDVRRTRQVINSISFYTNTRSQYEDIQVLVIRCCWCICWRSIALMVYTVTYAPDSGMDRPNTMYFYPARLSPHRHTYIS